MLDSTLMKNESIDDHVDDHVDQEIQACFSKKNPKCFFVFAGAGSGKTRSLISILTFLDKERGESLMMNGKQIAVITYTNAACDEISRRLHYNPYFLYPQYIVSCGNWLKPTKQISKSGLGSLLKRKLVSLRKNRLRGVAVR